MPPASENGGQGQRSWLPVHFRRTTAWSASVGTWWARSATSCAPEWTSASWIRTGGCAGSSGSLANRRRRSGAGTRDVPRLGRRRGDDIEDEVDAADVFQRVVVEVDELL